MVKDAHILLFVVLLFIWDVVLSLLSLLSLEQPQSFLSFLLNNLVLFENAFPSRSSIMALLFSLGLEVPPSSYVRWLFWRGRPSAFLSSVCERSIPFLCCLALIWDLVLLKRISPPPLYPYCPRRGLKGVVSSSTESSKGQNYLVKPRVFELGS